MYQSLRFAMMRTSLSYSYCPIESGPLLGPLSGDPLPDTNVLTITPRHDETSLSYSYCPIESGPLQGPLSGDDNFIQHPLPDMRL
ncbi:unnamed protein product [Amoebophrya sp. A120]|nr:unnamed protein product [Amoebophrya sp. A120]|eukprot:GSA120T00005557001.1